MTFADVVVPFLSFTSDHPKFSLLTKLINSPWVQRLREVHQTANTRLVYMFSEHSRFGHSLGVCYLADLTVRSLLAQEILSSAQRDELKHYWPAVTIAALLHDVGHLAPGSHVAFKVWFPDEADAHEELSERIICHKDGISAGVPELSPELASLVAAILRRDDELPPWTWELLSGGAWNVDRGNWCVADSVMAGVSYGKYNIEAIIESLTIDPQGHLALRENRLDAMMHFAVSRHAMYRQLYQHRVLLAADALTCAIVARARVAPREARFADDTMEAVLSASSSAALSLPVIYAMRESWWRYHLFRWVSSNDSILADLSDRLLNRRLFKTIRLPDGLLERQEMLTELGKSCDREGVDPTYYLHCLSTRSIAEASARGMLHVVRDDGTITLLSESDPLFYALARTQERGWAAVPEVVKQRFVG